MEASLQEKASPQPSPSGEGAESLRFEIFWFLDIFIQLIVFSVSPDLIQSNSLSPPFLGGFRRGLF